MFDNIRIILMAIDKATQIYSVQILLVIGIFLSFIFGYVSGFRTATAEKYHGSQVPISMQNTGF